MRRGEIWWANLAPRSGSEQGGRRPVILVSHDAFNEAAGWKSVVVVPMTTSAGRRVHTVVEISKGSFAVCHQVTTLDRAKLTKRVGALPGAALRQVEEGLKAALDLE